MLSAKTGEEPVFLYQKFRRVILMEDVPKANEYLMCPRFEKAFSILGKKWNGLIIFALLSGEAMRFKDITAKVEKCSDRVMVERLKELEKEGIVEKVSREDCCREFYQLTAMGMALKPVMDSAHAWADEWYSLEDCEA